MDEKKKSAVQPQEKVEKLSDAQLSQVSGGFEFPLLPYSDVGLEFGGEIMQPSSFTKSDDRLPSDN